ncbi:MAG: hypothetical protein AAGC44_08235 [Planctomycetota bacterium]
MIVNRVGLALGLAHFLVPRRPVRITSQFNDHCFLAVTTAKSKGFIGEGIGELDLLTCVAKREGLAFRVVLIFANLRLITLARAKYRRNTKLAVATKLYRHAYTFGCGFTIASLHVPHAQQWVVVLGIGGLGQKQGDEAEQGGEQGGVVHLGLPGRGEGMLASIPRPAWRAKRRGALTRMSSREKQPAAYARRMSVLKLQPSSNPYEGSSGALRSPGYFNWV